MEEGKIAQRVDGWCYYGLNESFHIRSLFLDDDSRFRHIEYLD